MEDYESEFNGEGAFVGRSAADEEGGAWNAQFWPGPNTERSRFDRPHTTPVRGRHRHVSHRAARPRPRCKRQCVWSYSHVSYFDHESFKMLIGWALQWMHGIGVAPGGVPPTVSEVPMPALPKPLERSG